MIDAPNPLAKAEPATLLLNAGSPDEHFAAALNLLDAAAERLAEFKRIWKTAALERCQERGAMVLGDRKFFASYPTETKCKSVRDAVVLLYEVTGGDFDALVGCLSANALKYGACRGVMGDRFGEVFETVAKVRLGEEKAKKVLVEVNERFSRK